MKALIALIVCAVLAGCDSGHAYGSGQLKRELFKECMELASKVQRESDDDVASVVSKCNNYAYYTSNHIMATGGR